MNKSEELNKAEELYKASIPMFFINELVSDTIIFIISLTMLILLCILGVGNILPIIVNLFSISITLAIFAYNKLEIIDIISSTGESSKDSKILSVLDKIKYVVLFFGVLLTMINII